MASIDGCCRASQGAQKPVGDRQAWQKNEPQRRQISAGASA